MDKETHTLIDYVLYRLYMKEANDNNLPVWRKVYRFTEFYQVPNMDNIHFVTIIDRMSKNETLFNQMMKYLWGEGPRGEELLKNHDSIFIDMILI
jgi:hypothetical protein